MQQSHFYRPDIDGLRAIAVGAVLLFHADIEWISGGFVGVDVFFVISGFLITSIIANKVDAGSFSIIDFWERRVRRIIPALMAVALFTVIGSWLLFFPDDYKDFSQSLVTITVFASNFLFWSESGYFASPAELKPLLHTWSLAIEEQFYLLFPFLMMLVAGKRAHWRIPVLVTLLLGSLYISATWVVRYPDSAFYLLPSRAWELAIGSLLVFFRLELGPSWRWLRELLSVSGLAMILYACFYYNADTRFPGLAALLPCVGTALLIFSQSNDQQTVCYRLLALRPVVFVGLLSYSLYLWHWPIIVFAKYHADEGLSAAMTTGVLAASFVCAYLSYRWIETPVRAGRVFASRSSVFSAAGIAFAVAAGIGIVGHVQQGLPGRMDSDVLKLYSGFEYINPRREECVSFENANFNTDKICTVGDASAGTAPQFVVFGDSHADALMPVIERMAKERNVHGLYTTYNGCPPLLGVYRYDTSDLHNCDEYNRGMLDLIKRENVNAVLLVGRWSFYPKDRMIAPLEDTQQRPSNWLSIGRVDAETAEQAFTSGFDNILHEALTPVSKDRELWVLQQVPLQHRLTSPRYLASKRWRGEEVSTLGVSFEQHQQRQAYANDIMERSAQGFNKVHLLDPSDILCDDTVDDVRICAMVRDGGAMYRDDDHLSSYGSQFLEPLFTGFFESISE